MPLITVSKNIKKALIRGEKTIRVPIRGGYYEIPRLDLLDIGQLTYTHKAAGAGKWKYDFQFDAREADLFHVGDEDDKEQRPVDHSQPDTWYMSGTRGWMRKPTGDDWRPDHPIGTAPEVGTFSITSRLRPGLIPVYFQPPYDIYPGEAVHSTIQAPQTREDYLEHAEEDFYDQMRMAAAEGFRQNGLKVYVIGPCFTPGLEKLEAPGRIKMWAETYGFTFLKPLVGAKDPAALLGTLTPETQIERDIVDALKEVLCSEPGMAGTEDG